jgi:hypothetical protein
MTDPYSILGNPIIWYAGTWERLKDRGVKARDIGVVWSND